MTVPNLLAAVCGLQYASPQLVTLIFDIPVTSAHYATGLSMRINGLSLPIVSVAQGSDSPGPHQVIVTLSGGPAYTATLDVSYDATAGDWNNGGSPVATFTHIPVVNGSNVGRPPTAYPLSSLVSKKLIAVAGGFTATVIADLNMVDSNLCNEYAPQMIDFGGTFNGIFQPQNLIALTNGLQVSQTFTNASPSVAAVAALAWEAQAIVNMANALATLRTLDSGVSFGADTIAQY